MTPDQQQTVAEILRHIIDQRRQLADFFDPPREEHDTGPR